MFRVGQEVVCIKDHSQGVIKKGQTFIIKSIIHSSCNCVSVDIGLNTTNKLSRCTCGNSTFHSNGIWWISTTILAPVEDNFADNVLENIKKQIEEEQLIEHI